MSKKESVDKNIKNAIEIGERNKEIIPLTKAWCKHIVVTDKSAGMIAEWYSLPMQQAISCPHTTKGFEALDFEWIARDFIIGSCIGCKFHEEILPDNFGRTVLKQYKEHKEQEKQAKAEEERYRSFLMDEVTTIIKKDQTSQEITTQSILSLVQLLENGDDKIETSIKIFEASKLSPLYFSKAVIDYLSLYFEEDFGSNILKSVCQVKTKLNIALSEFSFKRVLSALKDLRNFDSASQLFNLSLSDGDINNYESAYEDILNNCTYENGYGLREDKQGKYPHSIALFQRLHRLNPSMFNKIINQRSLIDDKSARINISGFLEDLTSVDGSIVITFLGKIIKSFEFEDDQYGESADHSTRKLLRAIHKYNSKRVIEELDNNFTTSTTDAKIEILKFYELLLNEKNAELLTATEVQTIIQKLILLLVNTNRGNELREQLLHTLKQSSKQYSSEFVIHFDTILGFLIKLNQEQKTLDWQIQEIKDASKPASTFNPLVGKSYLDIKLINTELQNEISSTGEIIENVLKFKTVEFLPRIVKVIEELDSKTEGKLKSWLIDILRKTVKDTLTLGNLLPTLYKYIYDYDSEEVRDSGMKFIVELINKHPQVITQTIIDTIKIFFDDTLVVVRGRAIEAFQEILKEFPEQVDDDLIIRGLSLMLDRYVFVHKRAARLSYRLYPFLDNKGIYTLFQNLLALEQHYYDEKDFDFCGELVKMLVYVTKEHKKAFSVVIKTVLPKYCNSGDYYTDKKFIHLLTEITFDTCDYYDVWLEQTINFLLRTAPDIYNAWSDERRELFCKFYHVKYTDFKKVAPQFVEFINDRIDNVVFRDIIDGYAILAYFNQFNELEKVTSYFKTKIQENKSHEDAHNFNASIKKIASIEQAVRNESINEMWLKSIENELSKVES